MAVDALPEPSAQDSAFVEVRTPKGGDTPADKSVPLSSTFWGSLLVLLLLPFQFGWSVGQLNLTAFNNEDDCNARPVVAGTCLMFPGHSKTEWTLLVNAWIVGGMIGTALFTDSVRATAVSMCIFINWVCNLLIGVFFPYISDALDAYKFAPFMVTTAAFFLFTLFWIPETAGKTTEEIQAAFRSRGNQKKPNISS
ncbi:hypothetical protein PR002_g21733 [Phytophthora rubi]|uniref:Major facilitator superfamily (MFS) profile domain-containing protein n=1 Tax=Phytophthora rubi TaxID=129364 RepID=A0A6A3J2C3_9STRA|nr:hypothetical protein PR002_g21733 [Phytophthora rubi]